MNEFLQFVIDVDEIFVTDFFFLKKIELFSDKYIITSTLFFSGICSLLIIS